MAVRYVPVMLPTGFLGVCTTTLLNRIVNGNYGPPTGPQRQVWAAGERGDGLLGRVPASTREVPLNTNAKVARIWHGWTTVENADAYQEVAEDEVFPAIMGRRIPGLLGAHLMRSDDVVDGEVEFTTIIWFEGLDNVKDFMGDDYRNAHLPAAAKAVLKRFDSEAKHFHVVNEFT